MSIRHGFLGDAVEMCGHDMVVHQNWRVLHQQALDAK